MDTLKRCVKVKIYISSGRVRFGHSFFFRFSPVIRMSKDISDKNKFAVRKYQKLIVGWIKRLNFDVIFSKRSSLVLWIHVAGWVGV